MGPAPRAAPSQNALETHTPPQTALEGRATWVSVSPQEVLTRLGERTALNPEKVPHFAWFKPKDGLLFLETSPSDLSLPAHF